MRAALVGLGSMGMEMAKNILAAGIPLAGCDSSESARRMFAATGAAVSGNVADVAAKADVLVVMVVNAAQVRGVLFGDNGALSVLPPGAVVVVCSTIAPAEMRALADDFRQCDAALIDAPVSGGKAGAEAGALTVMASGAEAAMQKARPVLSAISKKIYHLGDSPGIGSAYKVAHQLAAGVHLAVAAELLALGEKAGCDANVLADIVSSSAGQSWMFDDRAPRMIAGDFCPRSTADIFVKDLGLVLNEGKNLSMPLPLAAAAHQMFLAAAGIGCGAKDDSAVIRAYRALGGIRDDADSA